MLNACQCCPYLPPPSTLDCICGHADKASQAARQATSPVQLHYHPALPWVSQRDEHLGTALSLLRAHLAGSQAGQQNTDIC